MGIIYITYLKPQKKLSNMKSIIILPLILASIKTFAPLKTSTLSSYLNLRDSINNFSVCDSTVDGKKLNITSIDVENLKLGSIATFTISGTALDNFNTHRVNVLIDNKIPLHSTVIDKTYNKGDKITITLNHLIPGFVDQRIFGIYATFEGQNKEHIDCVYFEFQIKPEAEA